MRIFDDSTALCVPLPEARTPSPLARERLPELASEHTAGGPSITAVPRQRARRARLLPSALHRPDESGSRIQPAVDGEVTLA